MIAMRSARRIASSKSWVMKTMVLWSVSWSRRNSSCISRRISGSSAENGSSRNHSSGSTASERAMPTRCCWPPESWCGIVGLAAGEPDQLDHLPRPLLARRTRPTPCTSSGKPTLPSTERCGSSAKCWNTMPMRWRRISIISRGRRGEEVAAVEQDLARRRLDQPRHAADQRRLARARQAHDDEDLALVDRERDVADGDDHLGRGEHRLVGRARRSGRRRRSASRRAATPSGRRAWGRRHRRHRGNGQARGAPPDSTPRLGRMADGRTFGPATPATSSSGPRSWRPSRRPPRRLPGRRDRPGRPWRSSRRSRC